MLALVCFWVVAQVQSNIFGIDAIKPNITHCRMDWTDLHFRQLCRLMSKHTWLYTEMVVDQTLLHNPDTDR